MAENRFKLRTDWFARRIRKEINLNEPGIYEWRIGDGLYVGKATRLRSRLRAYPRNVRHMIMGLPYHGDPAKKFRAVHIALHRAYTEVRRVTVSVLENCTRSELNNRERYWIARRQREYRRGGPRVLN